MLTQARNISELEDAKLYTNRLLRRNSTLSTENVDLYQQVDELTKENRRLWKKLGEYQSPERNVKVLTDFLPHTKDGLQMELSTVCKENKKLNSENERIKSALESLEKEYKAVNEKYKSHNDRIKKHSSSSKRKNSATKSFEKLETENQRLIAENELLAEQVSGIGQKASDRNDVEVQTSIDDISCSFDSLDQIVIEHTSISNTQGDVQESSKEADTSASIHSLKCDAGDLACKHRPDGRNMQVITSPVTVDKTSNDSIDSGNQDLTLAQHDSNQFSSYSLERDNLMEKIEMLLSEKETLSNAIQSLQKSNENLTCQIDGLKKINLDSNEDFESKIEDLICKNSKLEEELQALKIVEKQLRKIQDEKEVLEEENRALQRCKEDASSMKAKNDELKMKLETFAIENKKAKDDSGKGNDVEIIKMLAKKSEERDAFSEKCSQLSQENEDAKLSVEYLAEQVTGLSLKGQSMVKIIDFVTSCYVEEKEHGSRLEEELEALRAGVKDGSKGDVSLDGECSESNSVMLEYRKSQHQSLEKQVESLQSECKRLQRNLQEVETQNDELHELNEDIVKEIGDLKEKNQKLTKDIEKQGASRTERMRYLAGLDNQLEKPGQGTDASRNGAKEDDDFRHANSSGQTTNINSNDLHEKLSSLTNMCTGLKTNLELAGEELSEWIEIGQLINNKNAEANRQLSESNIEQHSEAVDKKELKDNIVLLFDDYRRLKCTANLVKQQCQENEEVRQKLASVTSKNTDLQNQLAKLALRERQFHEVKAKLSKSCNEKNVMKRDTQQLKQRVTQYEEYYRNSESALRDHEQLRTQNKALSAENLKLQQVIGEHTDMLLLLQGENEMLHNEKERLYELENRENQRIKEIDCFKNELAGAESILREQVKEKRLLQDEVSELKELVEVKEFEIDEMREENSELNTHLSEMSIKVEEFERVKSENDLQQSISFEQRDTISNLHLQKAQLATEIDDLRSRLGSLDNVTKGHNELTEELEAYRMNYMDMERRYLRAKELADTFGDRYESAEAEAAEANRIVDVLSKEKNQLISECDNITKDVERLQELLEESNKEKATLQKDLKRFKKEAEALKTQLDSTPETSIYKVSKILAKSKDDIENYVSTNLENVGFCDKKEKHVTDMKLQVRQLRQELIEKEAINASLHVENTHLKINYETLLEKKTSEKEKREAIEAKESRNELQRLGSFQERLDAVMESNAKLSAEKAEMENCLQDIIAENQSLSIEVQEVGRFYLEKFQKFLNKHFLQLCHFNAQCSTI